jgi:dUTP pyrophosphatase
MPARLVVPLVRTAPNAVTPTRATRGSYGYDVHTVQDISFFNDHQIRLAEIGFKLATDLPDDLAMLVLPRSSIPIKHGLIVANSPGLVDRDYAGELMIELMYVPRLDANGAPYPLPYVLPAGTKIAQLLFVRVAMPEILEVAEDNATRTRGGFGSTDV